MKKCWIRSGNVALMILLGLSLCSCGGMSYHLNYNRVESAAREIVREVRGEEKRAGAGAAMIPGIESLKGGMKERYRQLKPFYGSGAVLEKDDGYVCMGDIRRVPLTDRRVLGELTAQENSAREQLYKAVVQQFNIGSDYTKEVARIFAREWAGVKK